jgi:mannitol-1-phosphate 5-dehydrogenase
MPAKRLVLVGAGMTGRGQVAQLAFEDGWDLTLVDRDADLVRLLQHAGKYKVRLLGAETRDVLIQGYRALHTKQAEPLAEAVGQADLVVTSVLEPNLREVAKSLAAALTPRLAAPEPWPLHVIAAENMMSSSTVLGRYTRKLIPEAHLEAFDRTVAFPDSMIARVVPVAADPLLILCEEYNEWTADRSAALGDPPALAGLEWVTNQTARLQRKLYIHNTGHAVCGYLGWLAGLRYIHEAALEPRIMARIRAAVAESGEAITREHAFDREEVRLYEEGS